MSTTGNALATRPNGTAPAAQSAAALAIRADQLTWDKYQEAALVQIGLRDASPADRAVFLHQCQRTGLDPFSRQIYMIPRQEKKGNDWVTKWTIQTGIDGWRVIRDRAERRAGVRCKLGRAVFYDGDGNEYKAWFRPEPPVACEITLTVRERDGFDTEYTSTLLFREYVQLKDGRPIAQWATKPAHMIEKCVEADVYRKAFPQDFSGIELTDAVPPGDPDAPPVQPQRPRVSAEQARARAPQRVQSEVIDVQPAGDPPPPEPTGHEAGDPRDAVLAEFERLGITSPVTRMEWVQQLARTDAASLDGMARVQVEKLLTVLRRCQSVTDLDALLADGEVPGGE